MSQPGAETEDGLRRLQRPLLDATLANARRTEFYRSLWSKTGNSDDLASLPIAHKADIAAAGARAQIRDCGVHEKFTSGTSSAPFVNIIGQRERDAAAKYYAGLYAG